jgi:predicted N-acetyltransferase YhbS
MLLRPIDTNEYTTVFQMGYKEWSKGRTYEQYMKDNQKEDIYGTRYVYVDESNNIIGSLIVLSMEMQLLNQKLPIYGLGSIVIDRNYQGKGYGKKMLDKLFSFYTNDKDETIFLLYSDINPPYYYSFQFRELPDEQQHQENSICMVRCNEAIYKEIIQLKKTQIPVYF